MLNEKDTLLSFKETSTCEKNLSTHLLTGAALPYYVGFVTSPIKILAVNYKYAELRSRYLSTLPVIVNYKGSDSVMICMG